MSRVLFAAAALSLFVPGTVLAQQAAPAQPAPAAAPATLTESEMEAAAEAFEARMETMQTEIVEAVRAAGDDRNKARADADVIVARYQPEADAFATRLVGFLRTQPVPEGGPDVAQMAAMLEGTIKAVPGQVRDQALAEASAPTAEEPAPATTPAG